jgi:hypothetical protein
LISSIVPADVFEADMVEFIPFRIVQFARRKMRADGEAHLI